MKRSRARKKKKKKGDGKAKGDEAGDDLVLVQTPCCTQWVIAVSQEEGSACVGSRVSGMRRCVVTASLTQGQPPWCLQDKVTPLVTQLSHRQLPVSS